MLRSLDLIIFDLDDTLIHSTINYSDIRNNLAELFDSPFPSEVIQKIPILKLLDKLKIENPENWEKGFQYIDSAEQKAIKNATVMEGAEVVSQILSKLNIKAVIYTNNSRKTVELYCAKKKFKFLNKFEIFTRDDFNNPKPHPEGLNYIIAKKNSDKEKTIYIGDSYIDARAAYEAGIKFIWFKSREIDPNLFEYSPIASFAHWRDFESLLTNDVIELL